MLKKTHFFSCIVQCCCPVFTLCLKYSVLASVSLRPPSLMLWLVSSCLPEPAPLTVSPVSSVDVFSTFLSNKLAARHNICKYVAWWQSSMVRSHGNNGVTTDEAFQALQELFFDCSSPCQDVLYTHALKKREKTRKKAASYKSWFQTSAVQKRQRGNWSHLQHVIPVSLSEGLFCWVILCNGHFHFDCLEHVQEYIIQLKLEAQFFLPLCSHPATLNSHILCAVVSLSSSLERITSLLNHTDVTAEA